MGRITRLLPMLLLLTLGALQPAPAVASKTQEAILQDDAHLKADPGATLATLEQLGVTRVRVAVIWSSIAPRPASRHRPHRFNAVDPRSYPARGWATYDQIVRDAVADGI